MHLENRENLEKSVIKVPLASLDQWVLWVSPARKAMRDHLERKDTKVIEDFRANLDQQVKMAHLVYKAQQVLVVLRVYSNRMATFMELWVHLAKVVMPVRLENLVSPELMATLVPLDCPVPLALEEKLVLQDLPVNREILDIRDVLEQKGEQDLRVRLDHLDLLELLVRLERSEKKDHQDLKECPDNKVCKGYRVSRVFLEAKESLEFLESLETLALLDHLVLKAKMVIKVTPVMQVKWESRVKSEPQDLSVVMESADQWVCVAQLEDQALEVHQVLTDRLGHKVQLAQRAMKDPLDLKVRQDHLGFLESKVQRDHLELMELLDQMVRPVVMENLVLKGLVELVVLPVFLVQLDLLALQVSLEDLDHEVIEEFPESQDCQEPQAKKVHLEAMAVMEEKANRV